MSRGVDELGGLSFSFERLLGRKVASCSGRG